MDWGSPRGHSAPAQRPSSAPGGARAHLLLPLLLLELVDAHERREQEVDEELGRELLRLVRAMIRGWG